MFIELNGISLTSAIVSSENGDSDSDSDSDNLITTRYPNGTVFSPEDLTNPSVIKMLSETTGIPSAALAQHIDVQFGTPISAGLLAEYRGALKSLSKASAEEVANLNNRYKRKLDATAKRGLKITVDLAGLDITKTEGIHIAETLPKLWNQVYTSQFITLLPSKIMGLRWTEDIHDLTSTIGLQEADIQIEALTDGVITMIADDRLIGLKNVDGVTAADILTYITRFRAIYFEPLFLAAFETDASLTRVYERDIQVQMRRIDAEIDELNSRLDSLLGGGTQPKTVTSESRKDVSTGLDGSALAQVVSLAEQASGALYIQATLEARFELVEEKAALQARLERMRPDNTTKVDVTANFVEMASERYQTIVRGYGNLLTEAQTLVGATVPSYYSVVTQPNTEALERKQNYILYLSLALAIGFIFSVIVSLLWPHQR